MRYKNPACAEPDSGSSGYPAAQAGRKQKKLRIGIGIAVPALLLMVLAIFCTGRLKKAEPIVILCTNDVHCGMEQIRDEAGTVAHMGYEGLAAYVGEMEERYGAGRVTLLDAGDSVQGEAVGTLSNGAYALEMMNVAGRATGLRCSGTAIFRGMG